MSAGRPTGEAPLLEVEDLTVSFHGGRRQRLVAVDGVSLELAAGETLGVVGESGCGKTTVARAVAGLQRPDSGRILLDGTQLGSRRTRVQRRAVQLVFQDPYSSLNPRLRVGTVLRELLEVHGLASGEEASRRSRELMALVGLPVDALDRQPAAFSGGQRQRLAIARALAVEPRVLVADEPTSALDVSIQAAILALFAELSDRFRLGMVMISHNLAAVRHLCDRVAVMYLGRVVESGPTARVFADPRHPYTRALLAAAPRVHGPAGTARALLAGEPPSPIERPEGCPFHTRCPRAEDRCALERPVLAPVAGVGDRIAACHFRDEPARAAVAGADARTGPACGGPTS